jgi:hypothetical protein
MFNILIVSSKKSQLKGESAIREERENIVRMKIHRQV